MKYFYPLALIAFVLMSLPGLAEGTRELAPNGNITIMGNNTTDIAALYINNPSYNNFAAYNNVDPQGRMYIHIKDPSKETIYFGFSVGHNNVTSPDPPAVGYQLRIKDPNGNIVFGPISMNPAAVNIQNWAEAFNGPQQLVGASGYDAFQVSSAQLESQGFSGSGNYYIEFADVEGDDFLIDFWDITVADESSGSPVEKKGRVWSYNWALFAINDFGFPFRPFNGAFYVCAPDPDNHHTAFVTKIDFNGSGFHPAAFNVAFNSFGSMNTGNVASDRRSVRNLNSTQAEYEIFLNDPVEICQTAELGVIELLGVTRCNDTSYCIKFYTTKAGQVDLLLDFDGNDNVFTPFTADLLIAQTVLPSQLGIPICIEWDGKDGLGNQVSEAPNTQIPVVIAFAQGIYHFPIYDAELMNTGVTITAVRPSSGVPKLYYDDTNIGVVSGTGEPVVQLAGCIAPCHGWTNYSAPNTIGFGNLCTINTWWFSQLIIREDIFLLPSYYTCEIVGPKAFCSGGEISISLIPNVQPLGGDAPEIILTSWEGPGIVGSNTGSSIQINEGGDYEVYVEWLTGLGDTCSMSCSYDVFENPPVTASIDTLILLGESVEINGETYNQGGTYVQHLTASGGCDSILTIVVQIINTVIHYDLDACWSFMTDNSHMDYSEFTPAQPEPLPCADISGGTIHRVQPQKHSCTPGVSELAMCVSSLDQCDYIAGDTTAVLFEITINPDSDTAVQLTGLQFYTQSPSTYNWVSGPTGPNNYPTRYGIRVLRNGVEIWRREDIPTTQVWNLESFEFTGDDFIADEQVTFTFELLPYCLVGNGADVAAWDIDEVSVQASCVSPNVLNPLIGGTIRTLTGYSVPLAEVQLSDNLLFGNAISKSTNGSGKYEFNPVQRKKDYFLRAVKDGDDLEGVTTLDLVVLRRHLLGMDKFNSPFQYIAADVNRSQSITVLDLVEIKKLILGIYDEFPSNTSWRMHNPRYELSVNNPWPLRELISLDYVVDDVFTADFLGIKIGDLNGDALKSFNAPIVGRNNLQWQLDVQDKALTAGAITYIDVTSQDVFEVSGLQMALEGQGLAILGIEPAAIPVASGDYTIKENALRLSWTSELPVTYQRGVVLFRLIVQSDVDGQLSNLLSLTPTVLRPEAYVNEPLDVADVQLVFGIEMNKPVPALNLAIQPNPARESVTLTFDMMCAERVAVSFFDVTGRLLHQRYEDVIIGRNEIQLGTNELRVGQGIVMCQVQTSAGTGVKRVMIVKD